MLSRLSHLTIYLLLACAATLPAAELVLSGTESGANPVEHLNHDRIVADGYVVMDGTEVILSSTVGIVLRPGTKIQQGAEVHMRIVPDLPPTAHPQADLAVNEDEDLPITLSGSDPEGLSLSFELLSDPTNGTLSGTPPDLVYRGDSNWFGSDAFTFRVSDGVTWSAAGTVGIVVNSVPDLPAANDDAYDLDAGQAQLVVEAEAGVLANDSNPLAGALELTVVEAPAGGALMMADDGGFTYVPTNGFRGVDTFTYSVSNDDGASTPARVSLGVANVPVAAETAMVSAAQLDWDRYQADVQFHDDYLAAVEPGRIWDTLPDGPPLRSPVWSRRYVRAVVGESVQLHVNTAVGAPVTFTSLSGQQFTQNYRSTITRDAADGTAGATLRVAVSGRHVVMVASPRAAGRVRFVIEAE
ncbi:MAG: Ig-like domain-containing protein [Planctomycetota bacterium]|jgi:hypothetical protein|nr:Ig-like domain-containing protein [Planctomycetota bacterium]